MEHQFKPRIYLWKQKEPNLKCFLLRFLVPVAGLIDVLITLCSFTILSSNFQLKVISLHSQEHFKSLQKKQSK